MKFMSNKTKIFLPLFIAAIFLSACVLDSEKKAVSQVSESASMAEAAKSDASSAEAKSSEIEFKSESRFKADEVFAENSASAPLYIWEKIDPKRLPYHNMRYNPVRRDLGVTVRTQSIFAPRDIEAEKAAAEKAEADRLAKEKAEAEKLALEKAEADRLAREKAEAEKLASEKAAAEKAEAERLAAEKAASEKATSEKISNEKLESASVSTSAEASASSTLANENKGLPFHNMRYNPARETSSAPKTKSIFSNSGANSALAASSVAVAGSDKSAAERAEAERLAKEKAEADRLAAEKAVAEKAEADRLAKEKAEADRLAAEKAEAERLARERAERERLAREKAEADRLAAEKAAAEADPRSEEEKAAELKAKRRAEAKLEEEEQEAKALVRDEPLFLNIATFNMAFCCNSEHYDVWEKRKNLIMPLFHFHNFDICGSQEPYGFQIQYLAEQDHEYDYVGMIQGSDSPDNFASRVPNAFLKMIVLKNMNNVIWYKRNKFEVLQSGRFWFSSTPNEASGGFEEDRFDSERHCNWALFRENKTQKTFYVFNVHLQVNKGAHDKEAVKSVRLLLEKVEEIARGRTCFVMGDFNARANYDCMKLIEDSPDLINSRTITLAAPFGPESTFYGFKGEHKGKKDPNIIDYILVSPDVSILKHGVITDNDEGVYPSDHLPVMIRSEFK